MLKRWGLVIRSACFGNWHVPFKPSKSIIQLVAGRFRGFCHPKLNLATGGALDQRADILYPPRGYTRTKFHRSRVSPIADAIEPGRTPNRVNLQDCWKANKPGIRQP